MTNIQIFPRYLLLSIMLCIFTSILSGCKTVNSKGQFVSNEEIQVINAQKSSKDEVLELIGTPTYAPEYSPNTWYYIKRSLSRRAWLNPEIVDQRIVKIVFDKNDKVKEALLFEDTQDESVGFNSDYTDTFGTKKSATQKFIRNIGRFNKSKNPIVKRGKKN